MQIIPFGQYKTNNYHLKKLLTILILLLSNNMIAQVNHHYTDLPKCTGYVNDFEKLFDDNQRRDLTSIITNFEKETSSEIAVVTVGSIGQYTDFLIYSIDLASFWGIGKKDKNNGLLILVSKNLRKVRISTGRGTEKILNDEICKMVIDTKMIPEFKAGNYYQGVKNGLLNLIEYLKNPPF